MSMALCSYWAHSMGPLRSPLSRVVVVVVAVVDIDAQAAYDSSDGSVTEDRLGTSLGCDGR